jgi:hypothetical protein
MTLLRERMQYDMLIRNLAESTQTSYLRQISSFRPALSPLARTAGSRGHPGLARLPPRRTQAGARQSRPNDWRTALPLPRDAQTRLERRGLSTPKEAGPTAGHSQPGGNHDLLRVDRQSQAAHHPDVRVRRGPACFRGRTPEGHRYRQPANGHPREPGKKSTGSLRDAVATVARDPADILARCSPSRLAFSRRYPRQTHFSRCGRIGLPSRAPAQRHPETHYAAQRGTGHAGEGAGRPEVVHLHLRLRRQLAASNQGRKKHSCPIRTCAGRCAWMGRMHVRRRMLAECRDMLTSSKPSAIRPTRNTTTSLSGVAVASILLSSISCSRISGSQRSSSDRQDGLGLTLTIGNEPLL